MKGGPEKACIGLRPPKSSKSTESFERVTLMRDVLATTAAIPRSPRSNPEALEPCALKYVCSRAF